MVRCRPYVGAAVDNRMMVIPVGATRSSRRGSAQRTGAGAHVAAAHGADLVVGALDTPVGTLTISVSQVGVAGIQWGRVDGPETMPEGSEDHRLSAVFRQLSAYFTGEVTEFDLPLDLRGLSGARRIVLETLYRSVPYGSSITYGELADRSGTGVPARGIGAIMGSNPLPIVIPCHRVLARNNLGGYSGGGPGEGLA